MTNTTEGDLADLVGPLPLEGQVMQRALEMLRGTNRRDTTSLDISLPRNPMFDGA